VAPRSRLAVVIVNWNSGEALAECLRALRVQDLRPDRTIVVDNASGDGSSAAAEDDRAAEVVRSPTNLGFAAANNLALRMASDCDLLATLNPDAFPEPAWLAGLADAADRHPEYASFASRMVMAADRSRLDGAGDFYHVSGWAGRRFHGHDAGRVALCEDEVFSACAAAALYRRDAVVAAGGFDENFFCYFEDVDLGFRLRLRGGRCLYLPTVTARHVGSQSAGRHSAFSVYHGHRNLEWTYLKDMPASLFWAYLPQHLALGAAALVRFSAMGLARPLLAAKRDAAKGVGRLLKARQALQSTRIASTGALRSAMTRGALIPYRIGYGHVSGRARP
jgi:GT2 family glycosyltransferase